MTKIVYNCIFGGFSLSNKATRRYAELAGITLVEAPSEYSVEFYRDTAEDDNYFSSRDISRTDPHLVQVVEELGKEANGPRANLAIIELPPGTQYVIEEYDGSESVMTPADFDWQVA
jgi:hypothetical protein